MRDANPKPFKTIALSAKALESIEKRAWPKGAVLSCACGCGYAKEKTPEEMAAYMNSWPKMHGLLANVKPL
jgi:hypothetical protein